MRCTLVLALLIGTDSAPAAPEPASHGALPAGWHTGRVASGRPYFFTTEDPGTIHWSLPEQKAAPEPPAPAQAVVASPKQQAATAEHEATTAEEPTEGGHRRRLEPGEHAVATLREGGRQLVRVARTHDGEGFDGGLAYTVTAPGGEGRRPRHQRMSATEVASAQPRFTEPVDGQVFVAGGDDAEAPAANITAVLDSPHLELGSGFELCIELFGQPLRRRRDGTPRVDKTSYIDEGESLLLECFDESLPLDLSDLPPGHFRLVAYVTASEEAFSEPLAASTTIAVTVLSEPDTRVAPSYDWQQLESWQTVGPGLELDASVEARRRGGAPAARIPPRWELNVPLMPAAFGTLAFTVGRETTVDDIARAAVRAAEKAAAQQPKLQCEPGHVHDVGLLLDGDDLLKADDAAPTVEQLQLFVRRSRMRIQVKACVPSAQLRKMRAYVERRSTEGDNDGRDEERPMDKFDALDLHEHPAHTPPPQPDPGFPLTAEAQAELRLRESIGRWAGKERDKLLDRPSE